MTIVWVKLRREAHTGREERSMCCGSFFVGKVDFNLQLIAAAHFNCNISATLQLFFTVSLQYSVHVLAIYVNIYSICNFKLQFPLPPVCTALAKLISIPCQAGQQTLLQRTLAHTMSFPICTCTLHIWLRNPQQRTSNLRRRRLHLRSEKRPHRLPIRRAPHFNAAYRTAYSVASFVLSDL